MGNIVNIDKTISAAGPNFKSIIEGTAISRDDPYFGKLRYKSNAHYIRINQDVRQRGLENYNISYIDLSVGDYYTTTDVIMVKSDTISFRVDVEEISDILKTMIKLSGNTPDEKITIQVYDKNEKVILKLNSTLYNVLEAMQDQGNPEV